MKNTLFLDALRCQNTSSKQPVWLLRQAGRYMAAYRTLRDRYSFEQLCLIPELAVTVTMQPIQAFDLDAAILFSDILFPLRVFGIDLSFDPKPIISCQNWKNIHFPQDIRSALHEKFSGIYTAARLLVNQLDRPLIGFAGAPWTLAAYLIGEKLCIDSDKQAILSLISHVEDLVVSHLSLQIESGCHAVQLFDSLSHLVPEKHVHDLILAPLQRIQSRLPPCPLIYYKASHPLLPFLHNVTALSFDESVDILSVRENIPYHIAIQGNLDPSILTSANLPNVVKRIRQTFTHDPGFIFNVARGLPPTTPESAIQNLVALIKEAS